jgi:thiopurine S-methyltransferase
MSSSSNSTLHASILVVAAATTVAAYYHITKPPAASTTNARSVDATASSEDRLTFWDKRWSSHNIGFHLPEVNSAVKKYADLLFENIIGGGARVLVPLCGKTVDMEHLTKKRVVGEVVGVDGVAQALSEYAAEHPDLEVKPGEVSGNGFGTWKGQKTTLLLGDFFDLDVKTAGGTFDAAWDRGSLVAIQPSLREKYVEKMCELMSKPNGRILLAAIVRLNGDTATGPPFSLDEKEVRRLYEGQPWVASVELLETHSASEGFSWFKTMAMYLKVGSCNEQIYLITTK